MVFRITSQINQIFHYLSPNTWFNWFISFVIEIPLGFNPLLHKRTWRRGIESPATEVYYMREKYGYFASNFSSFFFCIMIYEIFVLLLASPTIRSSRSEYVKFRVGQVVRHKIYGYRAVIIGWDEIASAPDQWLDEHHQGHPVSFKMITSIAFEYFSMFRNIEHNRIILYYLIQEIDVLIKLTYHKNILKLLKIQKYVYQRLTGNFRYVTIN